MGVVHKPDPRWASFIPVLIKAIELTDGPVLELGMGMFSTPLLHALCGSQDRHLVSYDNDKRFIDMFRKFQTSGHEIALINWDIFFIINQYPWSVVLVDQKPAEARTREIYRLVDVDYVVIHDSNDPAYDYESVYPLFKYRYDHKYLQHTTVLSNKHDVHKLYNTLG